MKPQFSLILNSRNRPQHLLKLLESIVDTTWNLDVIEVIIGLDKDDPTLKQSLTVVNSFDFAQYIVGMRPKNLQKALARANRLSTSPYYFGLNDDVVFMTHDWDMIATKVLDKAESRFPDKIFYGRTHDISFDKDPDGKYASFPILSQAACQVLGFTIAPEFVGLGGDVATYRIYEAANRVVDLPEIVLEHTLHQTLEQVMNPDQTAAEMRANTYENRTDWKEYDIDDYVWKLRTYINEWALGYHHK